MLRHTEGIKALKSEPENVNINSDVSITTDGWTGITQDSYYTITGKSESFDFELTFFCPCNDVKCLIILPPQTLVSSPPVCSANYLIIFLRRWEMNCKVLATRASLDRHTGVNLAAEINDTINEFGLERQCVCLHT